MKIGDIVKSTNILVSDELSFKRGVIVDIVLGQFPYVVSTQKGQNCYKLTELEKIKGGKIKKKYKLA